MLKRSRLLVIAVGGLLAFGAASHAWVIDHQCGATFKALEDAYAAEQGQQNAIGDKNKSGDPIWRVPFLVQREAPAEASQEIATQDQQNAEGKAAYILNRGDLCAQQSMARWTRAIGVFTLLGLFVLYITFDATRDAVIETRRIGEAQFRCYPDILEAYVELSSERGTAKICSDNPPQTLWGSGKTHPGIYITGKNFGQSHAYAFAWRPNVNYRIASPQAPMRRSKIRSPVVEDGVLLPPREPFTDSITLDFPLADVEIVAARNHLFNGPLEFYVLLKIRYEDVFENVIEKDLAFHGIAHSGNFGQKIPLIKIPIRNFHEGVECAVAIQGT